MGAEDLQNCKSCGVRRLAGGMTSQHVTPQATVWTGDCGKFITTKRPQGCSGTSLWTLGWARLHCMFSDPHCHPRLATVLLQRPLLKKFSIGSL